MSPAATALRLMPSAAPTPRSANDERVRQASASQMSVLINLAGRQRMLSQRLILHIVLLQQGGSLPRQRAIRTHAEEALQLMRRSHQQLTQGDRELPGLFSPALQEVFFGAANGDARIQRFMKQAEALLQRRQGPAAVDVDTALDELIAEATPMLQLLNQITQVFEQEALLLARREQLAHETLIGNIRNVAREAKMVAFNAMVAAHHAGPAGAAFSVVATRMSAVTDNMDRLAQQALTAGESAV